MNLRTIPRTAISGSLSLARLPLDAAVAVLPGRGTAAKLAVDQADANARVFVGAVLGDAELREEGIRLRAATQERRRAAGLRAQAEQTAEVADEQLEERHLQAKRRREHADAKAQERREQAARRRQQRSRQAAEEKQQRTRASRRTEARAEQRIDEQAPAAQLDAVKERAAAERDQQRALAEADEARRLEAAAEQVKEERKES